MMTAPAALRACFSEWRMVKTRKALQLIFEVPLEQQADVLAILGAPMPDTETWCGIARLNSPTAALSTQEESTTERLPVAVGEPTASEMTKDAFQKHAAAKQRYASLPPMKQAATRAAMLCADPRFHRWVYDRTGGAYGADENSSATWLRKQLRIQSRAEISEGRRAYADFLDLEFRYQSETGLAASDPYAEAAR